MPSYLVYQTLNILFSVVEDILVFKVVLTFWLDDKSKFPWNFFILFLVSFTRFVFIKKYFFTS